MTKHECNKEGILFDMKEALGRIETKVDISILFQEKQNSRLDVIEEKVDDHDKSISFVKWMGSGIIAVGTLLGSYVGFIKK